MFINVKRKDGIMDYEYCGRCKKTQPVEERYKSSILNFSIGLAAFSGFAAMDVIYFPVAVSIGATWYLLGFPFKDTYYTCKECKYEWEK